MNGNRHSWHLDYLAREYDEDPLLLQFDLLDAAKRVRPNFLHVIARLTSGGWTDEDLEVIREIIDDNDLPLWNYVLPIFCFNDDFPIDDEDSAMPEQVEIDKRYIPSSYSTWLMVMGQIGWLYEEVTNTEPMLWGSKIVGPPEP